MGGSKNRLRTYGKEVLNKIKYEPISSSIKPVHIANGLFRLILGEEYDITPLHEWCLRFNGGIEVNSASDIRNKYGSVIGNDFTDDEINKLREFLRLIFNADNAAFASNKNIKFSALTIASKTQINVKVQNEYKIPLFLHDILTAKLNNKKSPCVDLIKKHLNDETDDISSIAQPLTNNKLVDKKIINIDDSNRVLSGVELRIREAFDKLANNEKVKNTNKLLSLERIILLACFSIILHLSSRIIDLSNEYNANERFPILFDADGTLESIKFASEESLLLAKLGVEEYFEKVLEEIFKKEGYVSFTHEKMMERISLMPLVDTSRRHKKTPEKETREEYLRLYLGFYEQSHDPLKAMVQATRFKLFSDEYTTDPSSFITSFGGKIGLLYPRAGGRGRKRFLPDPLILETLLLATLDVGETIELGKLGEKLWNQFGVIIGANPEEDFKRLTNWNISQRTPGDLAGDLSKNAEKIANIYITMGYAKRYADGVTVFKID